MTSPTPTRAVVMGGSAGAFEPVTKILSALPPTFGAPVIVVVHLPPSKPSLLAPVLDRYCPLNLREVDDKETLEPGNVYIAPPSYHLLVEKTGHLSLSVDEPVHFSRPSIDVLFESAAEAYGASLIGVLLSGANDDGGRGIACIKEAGGTTIVQSLESAQSPAMPEAAFRLTQPDYVLPPDEIGPLLVRLETRRPKTEAP